MRAKREHAEEVAVGQLAPLLRGMRQDLGPRHDNPYAQDAGRDEWGEPEHNRARELLRLLEARIGQLAQIELELRRGAAAELNWVLVPARSVITYACASLREDKPTPAGWLVNAAVESLDRVLDAYMHGLAIPHSELWSAWIQEFTIDNIFNRELDHSPTATLRRVRDRWSELNRDALDEASLTARA